MSKKYILLQCGLSNRLRTIVGFWYIADKLNKEIIFHWDINDNACNGKWFDLFYSLNKETNSNVHIFDTNKKDIDYFFIGQDIIFNIIKKFAPELISISNIKKIEDEYYSKFRPKEYIIDEVNKFFRINYGEFVAIHIRRTDHTELAKKNNLYTTYEEFDKFIEDNKDKKIFLATDNADVQKKYKTRCLVYKNINSKNTDLRKTSLVDAFIDIMIASRCQKFKGSGYSSYSGLIQIMNRIYNGG
jgi:hypothetical protein